MLGRKVGPCHGRLATTEDVVGGRGHLLSARRTLRSSALRGPLLVHATAKVQEREKTLVTPTKRSGTVPASPMPQPATDFLPSPGEAPWPPKRPFAAVALDNLLDSVTDIGRHLRRMRAAEEQEGKDDALVSRMVPGDAGRLRMAAGTKPVVLVLGSGWGAHSLIKVVDTDLYDVVVVSPRNHFVFTPMLPSTAVGTVEFRSLLEPMRISNPCVTYLEAACDALDTERRVAVCTSAFSYDDGRRPTFEVQYDTCVVAVGEQPATFGVPGVTENCFFMKEVTDCVALRRKIGEMFELSALPGASEEERRANLHFVVVGGGPTGVEFAGTLNDFLREDLRRKYPQLMQYVRVTLLQSAQSILTQFDAGLGQRALEELTRASVDVRTGVRVVEVTPHHVVLKGGERLEYGVCLWSAGNAPRPLVSGIAGQIPEQAAACQALGMAPGTKLCVDSFLRVVGTEGLLALGDCTAVLGNRLPATAQVAGQQGAYLAHLINSGYSLGMGGYRQPPPYKTTRPTRLARAAESSDAIRWLQLSLAGGQEKVELAQEVSGALSNMAAPPWIQAHSKSIASASVEDCDLPVIDLEPPEPAAATYGGGKRTNAMDVACRPEMTEVRYYERPFEFLSLGIMAYVGNDQALTQVEAFDVFNLKLAGWFAFLLWRSVYITKQVSFRNRVLILFDWMKAKVFGRDISLF